MSVTLTNKGRRMRVFVLPHETYCAALGSCACVVFPGREPRSAPSSLTLPAESVVRGLSDAVLQVPEIARAVRALEVVTAPESPRPERTAPPGGLRGPVAR